MNVVSAKITPDETALSALLAEFDRYVREAGKVKQNPNNPYDVPPFRNTSCLLLNIRIAEKRHVAAVAAILNKRRMDKYGAESCLTREDQPYYE